MRSLTPRTWVLSVVATCGLATAFQQKVEAQESRDPNRALNRVDRTDYLTFARQIAAMPPQAMTKARVILIDGADDSDGALVGLDSDGHRIWQWTREATQVKTIATSQRYCWFSYSEKGFPFLARVNADDGRIAPFSNGREEIPLVPEPILNQPNHADEFACPRSMSVSGNRVMLWKRQSRFVNFHDTDTGQRTESQKMRYAFASRPGSGPLQLGHSGEGKLMGIYKSVGEVDLGGFRITRSRVDGIAIGDVRQIKRVQFPNTPVRDVFSPHTFVCDSFGRFYLARAGQVVIYDAFKDDAKILAVVGKRLTARPKRDLRRIPNVPQRTPGAFDPSEMSPLTSIAVQEHADGRLHLWCVESHDSPRRVAVWDITEAVAGGHAMLIRPGTKTSEIDSGTGPDCRTATN